MTAHVTVYVLDTLPAHSNAFTLGLRHENWFLRRDRTFDTAEEARDAFVERFCVGDEYWHLRRYFLGVPPPSHRIVEALRREGVRVRED